MMKNAYIEDSILVAKPIDGDISQDKSWGVASNAHLRSDGGSLI
jgi:hypothetical protein